LTSRSEATTITARGVVQRLKQVPVALTERLGDWLLAGDGIGSDPVVVSESGGQVTTERALRIGTVIDRRGLPGDDNPHRVASYGLYRIHSDADSSSTVVLGSDDGAWPWSDTSR
jgi:hypothetical protein